MSANKVNYVTLFDALLNLEADKKLISEDIRERIEAFSKQFGVNKKSVALNFRLYKMLQKDEGEFHEVTGDTDLFLTAITPEPAGDRE